MTPPIATAAEPTVLPRLVRPEVRAVPRAANVRVPRHLASVLDCAAPLAVLIDGALNAGIEFLSLQVARDAQALADALISDGAEYTSRGVRFQKLQNVAASAAELAALNAIERLAEVSQSNTRLTVTLAIAYDTKKDIAQAAAACGRCCDEPIEPAQLLRNMAARDLPPVDLFLQSGDTRRLSAFLLWHGAYAELGFMRATWAAFHAEALRGALQDYAARTRTFGAVPVK